MTTKTATPKRGSHGCFTHVEMWGQSVANLNHPRKCSRHHAPRLGAPTPEHPTGVLILNAECSRCAATVERTSEGNVTRERWTLR